MHSPGPSASDIQSHLYSSFLQASTYDVALRVSGTWDAIYKLHRVVLIQSVSHALQSRNTFAQPVHLQGFFRSLFTGGFSESAVKLINLRNGTDEINLIFDDLNITRPAFEVCISRLYGGGPALHVHTNLIPTNSHPLTPPFAGVSLPDNIPPGAHPASPNFLLSLLATAIYLSIPAVASQALSLILKTIGPTTVVPYLDFACGKAITFDLETTICEPQAAVGLENVAIIIESDGLSSLHPHNRHSMNPAEGLKANLLSDSNSLDGSHPVSSSNVSFDGDSDEHPTGPVHHYGAVSDKIGEACTCWLARWANDMLQLETQRTIGLFPIQPDSRTRSKSLSEIGAASSTSHISFAFKPPVIWRRSGLNAEWAAAIISADTLFVQNERERYNFARSVVELRRQDGVVEDEEAIWKELFEHRIYYANMTFDDLMFISQDMSPTTKRLYILSSSLQASHWTQSVLRHIVTQRPNHVGLPSVAGASPSPLARDKELGIASTTIELLTGMATAERNNDLSISSTIYFPVFGDSSARIGDSPTLHTAHAQGYLSMEELFNLANGSARGSSTPSNHAGPHAMHATEDNYFGIKTARFCDKDCVESDPTGTVRWSPYPPYRFSVEFWDVDLLREKSRLHSQTIWYAGSLFNVYVQIVRKKEQPQLGIYLHRQSHVDPIPASSAPYSARTQITNDGGIAGSTGEHSSHLRQPSLPSMLSLTTVQSNPLPVHLPSRSSTPSTGIHSGPSSSPSPPSSPPSSHPASPTIPVTKLSPAPQQPYRDPRSSISAYFSISCANAIGTSQTRFSSSPDVFSVSQSWVGSPVLFGQRILLKLAVFSCQMTLIVMRKSVYEPPSCLGSCDAWVDDIAANSQEVVDCRYCRTRLGLTGSCLLLGNKSNIYAKSSLLMVILELIPTYYLHTEWCFIT
ncbi:hypothetical protein CPB84DRAFT_1957315 [Gymnopilus junonius]|uniref:BTB domain-containing protein n=1 Tax=Gymnopilus junonius TaxID=109634 RepID=A0A9P5P0A1_GYMJU|nr:hypothetical protein CPB84DRAFT_1957315 [Gymnopilus junonius]